MTTGEDYCDVDYGINPYESFMRKHLQHYGYYTGKNQSYKNHFQQYAEWEKNYAYSLSSSSSSSSDSDSDDDEKNADLKLQEELLRTTQLIYSHGESGKMVPRLREPRSLYALNKELGPQQAARWPSDLQVINEKVRHIQTVPLEPEPFYKATGFEKCPMVQGEINGGRIVYCYETHSSFFMKSRVGGSRNGCESCSVKLDSEADTTLIFESRFESGNLGKAVQVGENEYELWLRYDLYTNKHTQWFYFRVANTRKDTEYRFTIVNFMKPDSLYNDGMRPLLYSEKDAAVNKVGWVREGQDIKYYKNNLRYESGKVDRSYYSLTWTVRFKHDRDTVYLSHCYPYTYTDLQDYLLELTNDPIKSCICRQRVLCQTLAGNLVYVLTITSSSQNPEDVKHKKAVVVTSRVHPGESNASWMMKGFLDFLTGNSPDAKLLRDTFIFKVVPMLNPDGVIVGNYRCSLAGRDLNRNYKTVLKDAYPSVWHTKTMIRKLFQEREIIVYCDLHGHSRRQNVFIYGCEQPHRSNKRFHERIFPFMLGKNSPEKFCFKSCKFKVQKSKENTGRVVMWNLGIMNSYTMEATFCGSNIGKKKGYHFNQNDFEMLGYHFCDTLLDYCDPDNTKFLKILDELEDKHRMELMAKIAQRGLQPENVDSSDISTDTESSDGGSDSSASNGPPLHLQFTITRPKRKKLKSKKDRDKLHTEKDEQKKKQSDQEDKRAKNSQIKPVKQEFSKQQGQPVRYTSNTPKRPKSLDDRSNSGIPVFVQERFEEKQQRRHNYLEALTAAYISNNIPFVNDPDQEGGSRTSQIPRQPQRMTLATVDTWLPAVMAVVSQTVAHFGYSGSCSDCLSNVHTHEELCDKHKKIFAAQFAGATSSSGACTESGQYQSAMSDIGIHKLTPQWLQEAADRLYTSRVQRGDSSFKISRLVGRREISRYQVPSTEDLLKSSRIHPAAFNLLERRHKPHILEVSAAQQRQTDALSRDKNSAIKIHPNPFDEISESVMNVMEKTNLSGHSRNHAPSVTSLVNLKLADIKEDTNSQMGFLVKGEERQALSHLLPQGSQNHRSRIRSAQSSHNLMTALSGSQNIQNSLEVSKDGLSKTGGGNNAAGLYIQKLIKETRDEIQDLTNEIQDDLEKKHLHKVKNVNSSSVSHIQKEDVRIHQKAMPDIGYDRSTFVSHLDSSKTLQERNSGDFLVGRKMGTAPATSNVNITKTSNQIRSVESSVSSTKLIDVSDLVVGNISHRETSIEKQAKARNLRRHTSFNAGTSVPRVQGDQHSKNIVESFSLENSRDLLEPEVLGQIVSQAKDEQGNNLSSKSYNHQQTSSIQSHHQSIQKRPTNRIMCNQHNLVFQSEASGEQANTVEGLTLCENNHRAERRAELVESEKKLFQPKSPL